MTKNHYDCGDVLIVGAGLAGIYASIKLSPLKVSVLAAAPLRDGASSTWAQGGIAAALSDGDTAENHARDTMNAGCFLNNPDIVDILTQNAATAIHDLFSYGIPFDTAKDGHFIQGREAAHSHNRIVKVGGDGAGRTIMNHLVNIACDMPHITFHESYIIFDIARDDMGTVRGVYARKIGSHYAVLFTANSVIFATGGIGHLYADTTNPHQIRGEGLGIAARHGAELRDTEFVQFHPTALDIGRDPCPLATEALRGEGAVLRDEQGYAFMKDIHPDGDLAPRDVVARAVAFHRMGHKKVFLDTRSVLGDKILTQFPAVSEYCISAGINPVTDMIPIKPAQHYHMGGIAVDSYGCASLKNLYVLGEAAGTGAHGANRLASNSLLEAVVFAVRACEHIHQNQTVHHDVSVSELTPPVAVSRMLGKKYFQSLRRIMTDHVGIIRTASGLELAYHKIHELMELTQNTAPFINYAAAALSIVTAAQKRTQTIGSHYYMHE